MSALYTILGCIRTASVAFLNWIYLQFPLPASCSSASLGGMSGTLEVVKIKIKVL